MYLRYLAAYTSQGDRFMLLLLIPTQAESCLARGGRQAVQESEKLLTMLVTLHKEVIETKMMLEHLETQLDQEKLGQIKTSPTYRRRIRDELSRVAAQLKDIGFDAHQVDVQLTTLALEMQRPPIRTSPLVS
jgi:hypothetical protein